MGRLWDEIALRVLTEKRRPLRRVHTHIRLDGHQGMCAPDPVHRGRTVIGDGVIQRHLITHIDAHLPFKGVWQIDTLPDCGYQHSAIDRLDRCLRRLTPEFTVIGEVRPQPWVGRVETRAYGGETFVPPTGVSRRYIRSGRRYNRIRHPRMAPQPLSVGTYIDDACNFAAQSGHIDAAQIRVLDDYPLKPVCSNVRL